jgi:hypothetical protein
MGKTNPTKVELAINGEALRRLRTTFPPAIAANALMLYPFDLPSGLAFVETLQSPQTKVFQART